LHSSLKAFLSLPGSQLSNLFIYLLFCCFAILFWPIFNTVLSKEKKENNDSVYPMQKLAQEKRKSQ